MHTFAKYLFNMLYSFDVDLSFRVGLRAMRLPVLEDTEEGDETRDASHVPVAPPSRYPRWFTLAHIEDEQCDIAATMLSAAKGNLYRSKGIEQLSSMSHLQRMV